MFKYLEEDRFPKRKNPRIKEFDYSRKNFYFVTICTCQKQCIFGNPTELNQLGKIAEELLLETQIHDHVIRNRKSYERIWNYIEGNPLKWEEDCFYISD